MYDIERVKYNTIDNSNLIFIISKFYYRVEFL